MKDFVDRVAVITGAGSGIGRALALDLAGRGARLAISDVDTDGLAITRTACEAAGAQVHAATLDVTDRAAVFAYADEVATYFGGVDLLVNNAGIALAAMVTEQSMADIDRIMDVDWGGVVNGTQAFLPKLAASGDGALVNISSVFGLVAVPGQSAYNAAKFAVRGYTEAIAQDLVLQDVPVSVHCVHPGGIRTEIARNAVVHGEFAALAHVFDTIARTSPEACAATILRGVLRDRRRILVGADAWALHLIQQTLGVRGLGVIRRGMHAAMQRMAPDDAAAIAAGPSDGAAIGVTEPTATPDA